MFEYREVSSLLLADGGRRRPKTAMQITGLPPLAPATLQGEMYEEIRSYAVRLAQICRVRPQELETWLGCTPVLRPWMPQALARQTGLDILERLQLRELFQYFSGYIPAIGEFRHRFCPECYVEMRNSLGFVFDPIAWRCCLVTRCPRHDISLFDRCVSCGADECSRWPSSTKLDVCRRCGNSFDFGWQKAVTDKHDVEDAVSIERERWISKQASKVIDLVVAAPHDIDSDFAVRLHTLWSESTVSIYKSWFAGERDTYWRERAQGFQDRFKGSQILAHSRDLHRGDPDFEEFLEKCLLLSLDPIAVLCDPDDAVRQLRLFGLTEMESISLRETDEHRIDASASSRGFWLNSSIVDQLRSIAHSLISELVGARVTTSGKTENIFPNTFTWTTPTLIDAAIGVYQTEMRMHETVSRRRATAAIDCMSGCGEELAGIVYEVLKAAETTVRRNLRMRVAARKRQVY